jgi:hypothetical protein
MFLASPSFHPAQNPLDGKDKFFTRGWNKFPSRIFSTKISQLREPPSNKTVEQIKTLRLARRHPDPKG